jgi:CheY-like chemotaxis protein
MHNVLLVEDNPGDVRLFQLALDEVPAKPAVYVVRDGIEAMQFLRREGPFQAAPVPSIIVLDLNLPRKDGRQALAEIRADPALHLIPVIVLSGSNAPRDILGAYEQHANCYMAKPRDLEGYISAITSMIAFWLTKVELPHVRVTKST